MNLPGLPNIPGLPSELQSLLADADTMERIYVFISAGGSLPGFCKLQNCPYGALRTWIRNDKSREQILSKAILERDEWAKESVLEELRTISLVDIADILTENGGISDPSTWPAHIKKNVSAIEIKEEFDYVNREKVFTGYTKRIKFHDKLKAIELVGRNLKVWQDQKDKDASLSVEELLGMVIKLEKAEKNND